MAGKEESGSGPHCEGPECQRRIRERKRDRSPKNRPGEGALGKATVGQSAPTFPGENASPGPTGLGGKARGFASEHRTGIYC